MKNSFYTFYAAIFLKLYCIVHRRNKITHLISEKLKMKLDTKNSCVHLFLCHSTYSFTFLPIFIEIKLKSFALFANGKSTKTNACVTSNVEYLEYVTYRVKRMKYNQFHWRKRKWALYQWINRLNTSYFIIHLTSYIDYIV